MRKVECLLPFFIIAVGVSLLYSCRKGNSIYTIPEFPPTTVFDSITDMTPAYAKGFKVTYLSDGTPLVDIVNPQADGTAADTFRLALVRASHHPDIPEGYHRLSVPISSAVCTSASQVSFFVGLDSLDIIKGITGAREQHSETVRKRIEDGNMEIIGTETSPDISLIKRLSPDVVLATPQFFNNKSVGDSQLTLIPIYSAYESHPLAQAEWIKLVAILIGKEDGGSDFFAKDFVWDAEYLDVCNSGKLRHSVGDFTRRYVLSAANDKVLRASDKFEISVRKDDAEISCREPPLVIERLLFNRKAVIRDDHFL